MLLQGKRLYADFFGLLPPGSYLLTAAWFGVTDISLGSARTLAILTVVGIACFTFLACERVSRNTLLSVILACGWVMMSRWQWMSMQVSHHSFATLFSMVAIWAALASLGQVQPRSLRWPIVAGVAAGATTVVMQTCGAWTTLAGVTAFLSGRRNRAQLVSYVFGFALVIAGILAFLVQQQILVSAFDDVVRFAITRYASIQYVPFGYGASIFDLPLKYVFPLAASLLVFISARDWRTSLRDPALRLCTSFALAGFAGCFPRPDIGHISFTAPLALPLFALCAARLARRMRPPFPYVIAIVTIWLCTPSAISYAYIARAALHAQVVPTPRGNAAFLSKKDVPELLPKIVEVPVKDTVFFYPYMPMLAFLAAREQVSKYDGFIPGYTTPAQYRDACLSVIKDASWVVTDWRADYNYWRQIYPSMPASKPQETIRFEKALDQSFELIATKGFFNLRRRREGAGDGICNTISGASS